MKRWLARFGCAVLVLTGAMLALDRMFPPNLSRLATTGTEILDRHGRTVALLPAPSGVWRFRTTVDDVAAVMLDTLVRTEDRHFWHHPGVNPLSLLRASIQDLRAGRIVSGGSTLTMQAARLLEPRPRTVRSKVIEIARALQLEAHFSKREILGIWLSLAPYGGNLEGTRAGSMAWFGASPRNLDAAQAALLVAIPRRPEALRPDRHPDAARRSRDRVLAADGGEVPRARLPFPRHARQAVAGLAGPARVTTTLDLPLQFALERLASERLRRMPERASMALLVLDARTREIRAAVSGGETMNEARAGALDLTRAVRSPGSAMKPFIYAMAFEDGIAGPETQVEDLPRRFGTYAPEDFDRGFAGGVTAGEALRRSLNLPAVALLEQIGPGRYAARMKQAGAGLRLPPGAAPSLPLALGGVGITLRDLTGLYAALATDGAAGGPRLLPERVARGGPFLQPRAAEAIASVLTQPFPDSFLPGIAWKTGTSWGGRDAWALGFDRAHVVGVWVGRPDGTPLPGATGRGLALPLLARVFEVLPAAPRDRPVTAKTPVAAAASSANALRLLFPPPNAVLSGDGPVTLRAMGGRRPLTFMVNGAPLGTDPARREVSWVPTAPGFYRLTVLDAEGGVARAGVRVK
ncbi:MAG: penicillin-binding protein 1C [Acetobacteraceae bacterium]|nr:penicillin-binding protein 1C [Acetobacteraceae bacterium]